VRNAARGKWRCDFRSGFWILDIAFNPAFRIPRSRFPSSYYRRSGFTVIELLMALLISTLILGAAASAFVTTSKSWERGSQTYKHIQVCRSISDLLERYIRGAVTPSGLNIIFWGEDLSEGDSHGHDLVFVSSAAGRFPRSQGLSDTSEIEFKFDPTAGEGLLMRIDSTPDEMPQEGGVESVLSNWVRSFEVMYYDGIEWTEEWYLTTLPLAVEFRVTVADPEDPSDNGYQMSRVVSMPLGKSSGTAGTFGSGSSGSTLGSTPF